MLKALNLLLSFLLELAMLAALGLFGFAVGKNALLAWVLGLSLPMLAAILWGTLAAPRSPRRLPRIPRFIFALAMFSAADGALYRAGHAQGAIDLFFLNLLNLGLAYFWKQ